MSYQTISLLKIPQRYSSCRKYIPETYICNKCPSLRNSKLEPTLITVQLDYLCSLFSKLKYIGKMFRED